MVAQCSESNKDTLTKYSAQQKIIWNICLGTKQIENGKKNNIKVGSGL